MATKTVVIGGGGFVGKRLVKDLLASGRQVVIIDRSGNTDNLPENVTHIQGDYSDTAIIEKALLDADEVVTLAYASVPKTSFEDPAADLLNNISPSLSLFEISSRYPLKKFVFVSTGGAVYGHAKSLPIGEDHPTDPISPYGITKLAIEKYAAFFAATKNLPVIIVRPANAYGEEQKPFTGQGLVATVMASVMQDKEIQIYGEKGVVRDYIHVDDISSAIVAVLENGIIGQTYNIGSGTGTSTLELLKIIQGFAEAANKKVTITFLPSRSFDVLENVLDSRKLSEHTGWKPVVKLVDGLRRTWDYHLANHGKEK